MKNKFKKIGNLIFHKMFFKIKEYHKEKLQGKSFILCPNHTSNVDGPVFWTSSNNISIMAKKECFENPIQAKFLSSIGVVSVDRDNKTGSEVRKAIKYFQEEEDSFRIYMMFPQGTISDINKNTIKRIKPGAFYIADKTGLPIVPVFIEQPRIFRKSRIVYGEPFDVNIRDEFGKMNKEKLLEYREYWMQEIKRLQSEAQSLEKRLVRKPKLRAKHQNNNNG